MHSACVCSFLLEGWPILPSGGLDVAVHRASVLGWRRLLKGRRLIPPSLWGPNEEPPLNDAGWSCSPELTLIFPWQAKWSLPGAEHSTFCGIALKMLPPHRQNASSRIKTGALPRFWKLKIWGKPVPYLLGLSYLLLLTLFSSPVYLWHLLGPDLMAHCLEHTKDKAFVFYFLCGIQPRVTLIRGSLQFPVKSFLIIHLF